MKILAFSACLVLIMVVGCNKNNELSNQIAAPADQGLYFKPSAAYLNNLYALQNQTSLTPRSACGWTEIPAGSTDAILAAVNNSCSGGVIYLKAGLHTENSPLVITKPVIFIGETGSIVKVKSVYSPAAATPIAFNPAFYVQNAPSTAFLNMNIQPIDTVGGVGIIFDGSSNSAVIGSKITQFQYGIVMVRSSNQTVILKDTVQATDAWKRGTISEAMGILNISGTQYIAQNDVSAAAVGIFTSDKWSTVENNYSHNNATGFNLCKYVGPAALPGGAPLAATSEAVGVKLQNNKSANNASRGIVVTSASNLNTVSNNELTGNGVYDIELTSNTYRLGFLQLASHDNMVNVGAFPSIKIKDCGNNNQVNGGVKVDITADPCK